MKVAFDMDDTLLIPAIVTGAGVDIPNYKTIAVFKWFQDQGHYMIIWSGGGVEYARMWAERIGLKPDEFAIKQKRKDIDIAFDDCDVDLGKVNVKVRRVDNQVSRKEWNKHEPQA